MPSRSDAEDVRKRRPFHVQAREAETDTCVFIEPSTVWTATREQIADGHIPLRASRLTPHALQLVERYAAACDIERVYRILDRYLLYPAAQSIRLPEPINSVNEIVVVPDGEGRLRIWIRRARRAVELHGRKIGCDHSPLLSTPTISLETLFADIDPAASSTGKGHPRESKSAAFLDRYRSVVEESWANGMCELHTARMSETDSIEMTANVVVPAMLELFRDARKVVPRIGLRWLLGDPQPAFRASSCVQRRNWRQARKAFPALKNVAVGITEPYEPAWDEVEHAISLGLPLRETLCRAYQCPGWVVDSLRFEWEAGPRKHHQTVAARLGRMRNLIPEMVPKSFAELQRLDMLCESSVTDLGEAIMRAREDGCLVQFRALLAGHGHDELADYAQFLSRLAQASGLAAKDDRLSLVRWIGQPTLREWVRLATRWHVIEAREAGDLSHRQGDNEALPSQGQRHSWPVPLDSVASFSGCEFHFLGTSSALAEEGDAMGHCVGGYADHCARGELSICHVYGPGLGIATLALSISGQPGPPTFVVQQIKGPGNRRPCEQMAFASERFAEAMTRGELPISSRFLEWWTQATPGFSDDHSLGMQAGLGIFVCSIRRRGRKALDVYGPCLGFRSASDHGASLVDLIARSVFPLNEAAAMPTTSFWDDLIGRNCKV